MANDLLWYLASPYSKYPEGMEAAFIEVSKQAAFLKNEAGIDTFVPIAHSHPVAKYGKMDAVDHDLWLAWDKKFIDRCDGMIVCKMPSWENSFGVNWEIDQFKAQGKPIIYMEPNKVPFRMIDVNMVNHDHAIHRTDVETSKIIDSDGTVIPVVTK